MFGQNERCGFTDSTGHYVNCVEPLGRDGLLAAYASAHLDYDTSGALELALEGATTDLCYSKGHYVDCTAGRRTRIMTPGENATQELCTLLECNGAALELPLTHMSYTFTLRELWDREGPHTATGERTHPGRAAAVVLFIFSFAWPHVKLVLLHIFYYMPFRPGPRRNGLYWFAILGKWSLADVLVMCGRQPTRTRTPHARASHPPSLPVQDDFRLASVWPARAGVL